MTMKRYKVLVIGLDGATFDLIRPWAAAGHLPTLSRLMSQGAGGELRSTIPPMTAPAWTSFITGKNPGKHGLYDWIRRHADDYSVYPVTARHCAEPTLWALLSAAGLRVCVFNVPMTYPPQPVNGLMISGLPAPSVQAGITYPPELLTEIETQVGKYLLYPDPGQAYSDAGIDAFIHGLESYVSRLSTPISELYAKEAMRLIINNLYEAFRNGKNMEAREKMALASTLAGLAIDVSRTTLLHALEHPVSGHLNAVHGEGLAALSLAYMEFTLPLCPEKFANVASLFGEDIDGLPEQEAAMKSIDGMKKFLRKFGMDIGLRELGVNEDMIDVFVEEAGKSPISKTNPRPASPADMREIYLKSL